MEDILKIWKLSDKLEHEILCRFYLKNQRVRDISKVMGLPTLATKQVILRHNDQHIVGEVKKKSKYKHYTLKGYLPEEMVGEGRIIHGLSYKKLLKSKGLSVKPVPKHMPDFNKKADELIKRLNSKDDK